MRRAPLSQAFRAAPLRGQVGAGEGGWYQYPAQGKERGPVSKKAEAALGHRIHVIPGKEEARLVYLGVAHSVSDSSGASRLVVDIGGGSTECIVGERFDVLEAESMHMGCVSYTRRFFEDGALTREAFREATTSAQLELAPLIGRFQSRGWTDVIGSSGTINALASAIQINEMGQRISREGLRWVRKQLIGAGSVEKIGLRGLSSNRAQVIPGGLAILEAVFKSLDLAEMQASQGALREGVLYDLMGRIHHEDARDQTISVLSKRYGIDRRQVGRVHRTAKELFDCARVSWDLNDDHRRLLYWACQLHEVGLAMSFEAHQRHGAYLVEHSDMPGFSRETKRYLAALIGATRRRLKPERQSALEQADGIHAVRLALLLRLARVLHRGRGTTVVKTPVLEVEGHSMSLDFPEGWIEKHPMTRADLKREAEYLDEAGFVLFRGEA